MPKILKVEDYKKALANARKLSVKKSAEIRKLRAKMEKMKASHVEITKFVKDVKNITVKRTENDYLINFVHAVKSNNIPVISNFKLSEIMEQSFSGFSDKFIEKVQKQYGIKSKWRKLIEE